MITAALDYFDIIILVTKQERTKQKGVIFAYLINTICDNRLLFFWPVSVTLRLQRQNLSRSAKLGFSDFETNIFLKIGRQSWRKTKENKRTEE